MINDYLTAVTNIRKELKRYIQQYSLKSLILGLSGGIDSTLTAVLAKPVCDELAIPLIGRSITIVSNKSDEISRARNVGKHFTTDFGEVELSDLYYTTQNALEKDEGEVLDTNTQAYKIRMGNIKVRMRMLYLYNLASKHKGLVLSTDNYTEYLLGFWTLHGDVGDLCMIQMLWKTEVYAMSRYLASLMPPEPAQALLDCVTAVPTDGLGITNSDLDQIGKSTYEEVDQVLIEILKGTVNENDAEAMKIVQRNRNSEFKRKNPYNFPREIFTTDILY